MSERRYRIGEVAAQAGVSTRTLRYYEERGLLDPAGHSVGGSRRYSEAEVARVARIRELQAVMGFDLDQICHILGIDDRLAQLSEEFRGDPTESRRADIVRQAFELYGELDRQVRAKQSVLADFAAEIESKLERCRNFAVEHDMTLPAPEAVTAGS
jgi:MerR family transcriptional regulator, repressor of the yfmOP operon